MTNKMKERLAALGVTGVLLGGGALVLAQTETTPTPAPTTPAQTAPAQVEAEGFKNRRFALRGPGFGFHGLPFGRLALGTTVEVTFYDGNPDEAGAVLETLSFTYGEDSEAAFAQSFDEARQDAAYVTVEVGEQTRTVDLSAVTIPTDSRGLLPRELAYGRGLQDGGTITATFYDGNPEAGGEVLETLTFTYGEDSEAGFADSFTSAAEEAAFVTVTTSPQTYTVDLSALPEQSLGDRGFGNRGFGGRGHR